MLILDNPYPHSWLIWLKYAIYIPRNNEYALRGKSVFIKPIPDEFILGTTRFVGVNGNWQIKGMCDLNADGGWGPAVVSRYDRCFCRLTDEETEKKLL